MAVHPLPRRSTERRALLALLLGATTIAFAPILVAWSEVGPVATAFHRTLIAVPALAVFALVRGARSPSRLEPGGPGTHAPSASRPAPRLSPALVPGLALAGALFAGDLALWHWSIRLTSVANATLLANAAPLFVALAAWRMFGERPTRAFVLALLLALGGTSLLIGADFRGWTSLRFVGDLLGLATALFYGGYQLTVKRLRGGVDTVTLMLGAAIASTVCLGPIAWMSGETMLPRSPRGWWVLVGLGWGCHAAGQGLIAYALAHLPASFSAVALLWQPTAAAALAWVLLSQPLGGTQLAGGALALLGIALARRASRRQVSSAVASRPR